MTPLKSLLEALKNRVGDIAPTCRQAGRLQSQALDRPLTRAQRFGLAIHLALCKWCRRYGKQLRLVKEAASRSTEALAAPTLSAETKERLRRSLQKRAE